MYSLDPKWRIVRNRSFHVDKHLAHSQFHNTIRNLINSKRLLAKMLKEKDYDAERFNPSKSAKGISDSDDDKIKPIDSKEVKSNTPKSALNQPEKTTLHIARSPN